MALISLKNQHLYNQSPYEKKIVNIEKPLDIEFFDSFVEVDTIIEEN